MNTPEQVGVIAAGLAVGILDIACLIGFVGLVCLIAWLMVYDCRRFRK